MATDTIAARDRKIVGASIIARGRNTIEPTNDVNVAWRTGNRHSTQPAISQSRVRGLRAPPIDEPINRIVPRLPADPPTPRQPPNDHGQRDHRVERPKVRDPTMKSRERGGAPRPQLQALIAPTAVTNALGYSEPLLELLSAREQNPKPSPDDVRTNHASRRRPLVRDAHVQRVLAPTVLNPLG